MVFLFAPHTSEQYPQRQNPFNFTGHCIDDGGDSPRYTARHIYRFNFETPDCENPSTFPVLITISIQEAFFSLRPTYGGLGDFALLKLKTPFLDYFNPFWCGWDRSDATPAAELNSSPFFGRCEKDFHLYPPPNYYLLSQRTWNRLSF